MDTPRPAAEVAIDVDLVRSLLSAQYPERAADPIEPADEGWDNVTFRLGRSRAVRLPRRAAAVPLLLHEQRWLPGIARRLDVAVPLPEFVGSAGPGYPWPWSVVPWIEGTTADAAATAPGEARRLGTLLAAVHRPAPADAPANPFRGVPLSERAVDVEARLDALGHEAAGRLLAWWRDGVDAPAAAEPVLLHGDLHPRNIVVREGRIVGLIDWGDVCAGDPATDLASAFLLFPDGPRSEVWEAYGSGDPDLVRRARAWAVFFATMLATTDEERHRGMGVRLVDTLLTDPQNRWTSRHSSSA